MLPPRCWPNFYIARGTCRWPKHCNRNMLAGQQTLCVNTPLQLCSCSQNTVRWHLLTVISVLFFRCRNSKRPFQAMLQLSIQILSRMALCIKINRWWVEFNFMLAQVNEDCYLNLSTYMYRIFLDVRIIC